MFFLPNTCLRSSLFLCSHSSDLLLSHFSHFYAKDSFLAYCHWPFWFSFLHWIKVLILYFFRSLFPLSHTIPQFSALGSYQVACYPTVTSALCSFHKRIWPSFVTNLLLAWMDYRLNHYHLFCFSCNAWKFSSTLPSCKGSLVMHSKPSLDGLDLLIYGHWLTCRKHSTHTKATVLFSSILLRSLLTFRASGINRGQVNRGHVAEKGKHSPY